MEQRFSKRMNSRVSKLGFGGWQLGNTNDWGEMSFQDGVNLVKEALNQGITFFDTAPNYSDGRSELIIGEALKGKREKVYINTKFGHDKTGIDFSVDNIEKSIDRSLERLQTDYIDSVILHNPPREILEGKSEHEEEFKRLIGIGKIKGYGVSIDSLEDLQLVLENLDVDVIELLFNINSQETKQLFNEIKQRGILLIIKVPLDSGWLTGKYNQDSVFTGIRSRWDQETKKTRTDIVNKIKEIVKEDNLVKYAISFILSFDAVTTVIPGVKNVDQLKANIDATNHELDYKMKIQLEQLYDQYISKQNVPW